MSPKSNGMVIESTGFTENSKNIKDCNYNTITALINHVLIHYPFTATTQYSVSACLLQGRWQTESVGRNVVHRLSLWPMTALA